MARWKAFRFRLFERVNVHAPQMQRDPFVTAKRLSAKQRGNVAIGEPSTFKRPNRTLREHRQAKQAAWSSRCKTWTASRFAGWELILNETEKVALDRVDWPKRNEFCTTHALPEPFQKDRFCTTFKAMLRYEGSAVEPKQLSLNSHFMYGKWFLFLLLHFGRDGRAWSTVHEVFLVRSFRSRREQGAWGSRNEEERESVSTSRNATANGIARYEANEANPSTFVRDENGTRSSSQMPIMAACLARI